MRRLLDTHTRCFYSIFVCPMIVCCYVRFDWRVSSEQYKQIRIFFRVFLYDIRLWHYIFVWLRLNASIYKNKILLNDVLLWSNFQIGSLSGNFRCRIVLYMNTILFEDIYLSHNLSRRNFLWCFYVKSMMYMNKSLFERI